MRTQESTKHLLPRRLFIVFALLACLAIAVSDVAVAGPMRGVVDEIQVFASVIAEKNPITSVERLANLTNPPTSLQYELHPAVYYALFDARRATPFFMKQGNTGKQVYFYLHREAGAPRYEPLILEIVTKQTSAGDFAAELRGARRSRDPRLAAINSTFLHYSMAPEGRKEQTKVVRVLSDFGGDINDGVVWRGVDTIHVRERSPSEFSVVNILRLQLLSSELGDAKLLRRLVDKLAE